MRAGGKSLADDLRQALVQGGFRREIQRRWGSPHRSQDFLGVLGGSQLNLRALAVSRCGRRQEQNIVSISREMRCCPAADIFENPHHTDHRSGINCLTQCLVIEANITAGNGCTQRPAGRRYAINHRSELSHDCRLFRIAKIQAIGRSHRPCSGAGDVAGRFRYRMHGAKFGIEITPAPIAIERHGQRAFGALDADQSTISARPLHSIGLHHVLVLLVDPSFGADVRRSQQRLEFHAEILVATKLYSRRHFTSYRRLPHFDGSLIDRSVIRQRLVGNFRDNFAVLQHSHLRLRDDAADLHRVEAPFVEDFEHLSLSSPLHYQQHALLRLAEHDLVGRHRSFTLRHAIQFDLQAHGAASSHFASGARESGRAHILNADHCARFHGLETSFQQQLLQKWIADLHIRPLLL